ncbi:cation-translocating P-type ATPase [Azospirillum doebereinerae]|uniref:HAD family hydrolase n=1 Tax=Azospirillum doebereinerae TaxID=92933 RepID=A0A3S0WMN7_9PROT|nr:HAD-IC family P-type ATPase [Azospirillum doebereinerae]RUQ72801.1 HAD family hydrolase [Azospirillum doebereinerae]
MLDDRPAPPEAWHSHSGGECLRRLDSRPGGLTPHEVEARQRRHGPNSLPAKPPAGWIALGLRQFLNPLALLLLAAAAVSLALGEFPDAGFILLVLVVNAVVGALQEGRAERGAAALGGLVRQEATVLRADRRQRLDAAELVPGDIVVLEGGDLVPADIRLLEAERLTLDESLLTGESLPVEKTADAILPAALALGERTTLLHAGSLVQRGRAVGVVVATGLRMEIGQIARALERVESKAPLVLRLERFTRLIGAAVVGAVAALAAFGLILGLPPAEIFFVAVALAVSAIPEGLPIAVTVALAVAARRMARRNVIVRTLPMVEGLGACTVIASDKTGTLTENALTVQCLWLPDGSSVEAGRDEPPEPAIRLATAGALCNDAALGPGPGLNGDRSGATGDAVDVALLLLASRWRTAPSPGPEGARCGAIPYEPANRMAAVFTRRTEGVHATVKGAVEAVLPMCRGESGPILAASRALAEDGHRVLAIAEGRVEAPGGPEVLRGLTPLGLVALADPLRPEAAAAVRDARAAGVRVCMVTGDHPATALAIARRLGIADARTGVVHGDDLAASKGPEERRRLVADATVFARIEPLQKLLIVEALKANGDFVAVTGDGVNDAPALASAHIGVAMGRNGTDAARRAAGLILADDNFASIVAGIREGRIAYANIRKVVAFLMASSIAEIGVFFLSLAFGLPLPFFALQLLWLNLVTDTIQHMGLALEREEPGLLARGPRAPSERLFDRWMVAQTLLAGATMAVVCTFAYRGLLDAGHTVEASRNLVLLLMVCFQNVHVFNCRSEIHSAFGHSMRGNPWLLLAVLTSQAVHLGAMYTPGLRDLLGLAPVAPLEWMGVAGASLGLILVMETYKAVRRALGSR